VAKHGASIEFNELVIPNHMTGMSAISRKYLPDSLLMAINDDIVVS